MGLILYITGCAAALFTLIPVWKSLKKRNIQQAYMVFILVPYSWLSIILAWLILKDIQYKD